MYFVYNLNNNYTNNNRSYQPLVYLTWLANSMMYFKFATARKIITKKTGIYHTREATIVCLSVCLFNCLCVLWVLLPELK